MSNGFAGLMLTTGVEKSCSFVQELIRFFHSTKDVDSRSTPTQA